MPSITTSFIDFLMYIAPGFVVLYTLRNYFKGIKELIDGAGPSTPTLEALVPLLLLTIAAGVVVKALSQILVRFLGFIARIWKKQPPNTRFHLMILSYFMRENWKRQSREERIDIYRNIIKHEADKLQIFDSYIRSMQTNAAMATALIIAILSMLYHHVSGEQPMTGYWVKFAIIAIFTVAMLIATSLNLETLRDLMAAFSPSPNQTTHTQPKKDA